MTFEERVLAIKTKFEEATQELLEMVSESPSRLGDIMRVVYPDTDLSKNWSLKTELTYDLTTEDESWVDRINLPWQGQFLTLDERGFRREVTPDTMIPTGEVFVMVHIRPENVERTQLIRDLAAGEITGKEYMEGVEALFSEEEEG